MKLIPLTHGKFATVDDADHEWLSQWKWHATRRGKTWYARRGDWTGRTYYMHREVLGVTSGETDHKDGNGLNNIRSNLRSVTRQQNCFNMGPQRRSRSGIRGVHFNKNSKKWVAQIQAHGKRRVLGSFPSVGDASAAYSAAAKDLYGEFARV